MANYTDTYWDVDGTSLETYAWGIQQLVEAREAPPPLRGEDYVIPEAAGQLWVPKVPDSRVITLEMWVIGQDAAGNVTDDAGWRANLRALRALLWVPDAQVTLTKRWRASGGGVDSASAEVQYAGGLTYEVEDRGLMVARTSVDLKLADPYFYGTTSGEFTLAP